MDGHSDLIVEQRSHILYVNDVQPVASDTVAFGKLYAEYDAPEDATEEAVLVSLLAAHDVTGVEGRTIAALPVDELRRILAEGRHA